jgi:hypothetical protein
MELTEERVNDCIIIGAGISGLAAAQMLQKHGFKVKILEANSRIGGRICPMELPANLLPSNEAKEYEPVIVQCGANWVHDLRSSNPIYRMIEKEHLTLFDTHDGDHLFGHRCYISDRSYYETNLIPRIYSSDELNEVNLIGKKMEQHYFKIRKRLRKLSAAKQHQVTLYDTIQRTFQRISSEGEVKTSSSEVSSLVYRPLIQQLLSLHMAFMGFSEGYELDQVSFTRWFDVADEDYEYGEAIICEGTSRLLTPLSETLDIKLNTQIQCIDWSELHSSLSCSSPSSTEQPLIHLHTPEGDTYSAPHVIITTSVGVLQSGSVSFIPPLPSGHQQSLSVIQMAKMNIVILRFKKCFWSKNYLLYAATPPPPSERREQQCRPLAERNDLFSHFYNLTLMRSASISGESEEDSGEEIPPLLFGEISGEFCDLMNNCTLADLAASAFLTLQMIFGVALAEPPIGCITKIWNQDPLTLGSWCNYCVGVSPQDVIQLGQPICSCCPSPEEPPPNPLLTSKKKRTGVLNASLTSSLQISGEGTSPIQVGTLQGAHETGVRSAKHILQYHKHQSL